MASYHDLLDAIARIRSVTGDPDSWQKGLTGEDVTIVCNPASPAAELGAVLAKVTAAHPEVFLAASPAGAPFPPPRIGEGAAADAIREAEAALAHQNTDAAHVDFQVVTAVLNAHAAHAEGVAELGALQRDIEAAVAERTNLDTPAGAREFQRFLSGKVRDIRTVVETGGLDATSKASLAAALTVLYASSTPEPPPSDGGPIDADPAPSESARRRDDCDETPCSTTVKPRIQRYTDPLEGLPPHDLDTLLSDPIWADVPRADVPWADVPWGDPPWVSPPLSGPLPAPAGMAPAAPMPASSMPAPPMPAMAAPAWGGLPGGSPFGGMPTLAGPPMPAPLPELSTADLPDRSRDAPDVGEDGSDSDPGAVEAAATTAEEGEGGPSATGDGTVVLPGGQTITAPSPELAAVITAAVAGTPIPDAFRLQGITIPAPGSPVSAPLDPAGLTAGDIGLFIDRHALALGDGTALLDTRIQPIASVSGPGFLGWQHPDEPATTTATPDRPAPNRAAATAPS